MRQAMVRHLRFLLVLLCLPLALIVTTALPAQAVTPAYGPTTPWSVTYSGHFLPGDVGPQDPTSRVSCSGNARTKATVGIGPGTLPDLHYVEYNGVCETGSNVSSAIITLAEASGSTCSFSNGTDQQVDGSPTIGGLLGADLDSFDCSIDQFCLTFVVKFHSNPFSEQTFRECTSVAIGVFLDATNEVAECFAANSVNVSFDQVIPKYWNDDPTKAVWYWTARYKVAISGKAGYDTSQAWWPYVVYKDTPLMTANAWTDGDVANDVIITLRSVPAPQAAQEKTATTFTIDVRYSVHSSTATSSDPVQNIPEHIGVGVYWTDPQPATGWATATPQRNLPTYASLAALKAGNARMGLHALESCSYYYGQKIVEVPGTDVDTPGGPIPLPTDPPPSDPDPLPDPVPPEDPGGDCSFSFFDPSTWATGSLCQLVRLMYVLIDGVTRIASAVKAVASAVVNGIGDLLESLFVPEDDVLTDIWDDLQEQTADSDLNDWYEPIAGVTNAAGSPSYPLAFSWGGASIGAGGGCSGPVISWDKLSTAGLPSTMHPFQACTGITATIAPVLRMFLFALIGIGGFFKGLQVILAGLGIERERPRPFRMASAEEMGMN